MKEMTSCRCMDQLCMDTDCISAYRLGIDDVVIFVVDHRFWNIPERRVLDWKVFNRGGHLD